MFTCLLVAVVAASGADVHRDFSQIRGFNYTPSSAYNDIAFWRDYDRTQVERELDFAKRLNLNEARVFLSYVVYEREPRAFLERVRHFVRAAHARGMGTMLVVWDQCCENEMPSYEAHEKKWYPNPGPKRLRPDFWPAGERYARDLVTTLAKEPGLSFWDIMNEPAIGKQEDVRRFVAHFAEVFRKLDPKTPITVGAIGANQDSDTSGSFVDVLSYHDYSATRAGVSSQLQRGREIAKKYDKPLILTEAGCIGRANPYDMALEIYMNERLGWYIWELMISQGHWGRIHGVVYADGTVRDPSIAAALMGFFRNRGRDAIPYVVDQEKAVTRAVRAAKDWIDRPDASWEQGLSIAETAANLLAGGEAVPMADLPSRRVEELRRGAPNRPALADLLGRWIDRLTPLMQP